MYEVAILTAFAIVAIVAIGWFAYVVALAIEKIVGCEMGKIAIAATAFMCTLFGVYMWANADPVIPGNIDLDNRPVVIWEDGTFSTEISISVEFDGLEVLIPTIIDGKLVSVEDAIQHYLDTGEHLGKFSSVEECEAFAVELHLRQQAFYGQGE